MPDNKKPLILIHKDLILLLTNLPPKKRSQFINLLQKKQINCLSEIFSNFLKSNLTDNKKIIKKARPFRNLIKRIALKKTPLKSKISILASQRGGSILGILLPIAATIISNLIK